MQLKEHVLNFQKLLQHAKRCNGLTPEMERHLETLRPRLVPLVREVIEESYALLDSHDLLKGIHASQADLQRETTQLIEEIFTKPFDEENARAIYQLGQRQMDQNLPIELIGGLLSLVGRKLIDKLFQQHGGQEKLREEVEAVLAALAFNLQILQRAFLDRELKRFCQVTGMSPKLIEQLSRV